MDDIVKQAMAKWPNVPHCYGWLALDARGDWRMRDERAQTLKLPGDRITNAALLAFINRNYTCDDKGRWYFQNGPQRVYVNLEATPYILRIDPQFDFVLHTGEPIPAIDAAWLVNTGQLLVASEDKIALIDDRDLAQCLPRLRSSNTSASDEDILTWLSHPEHASVLTLEHGGKNIRLQPIAHNAIAARFGFEQTPQPDAG